MEHLSSQGSALLPAGVPVSAHSHRYRAPSHEIVYEFALNRLSSALRLHWYRSVRLGQVFGWSGRIWECPRKQPLWRGCRWARGWVRKGVRSLEPGWKGCWLVLLGSKKHPAEHVSRQGPWPRGKRVISHDRNAKHNESSAKICGMCSLYFTQVNSCAAEVWLIFRIYSMQSHSSVVCRSLELYLSIALSLDRSQYLLPSSSSLPAVLHLGRC